MTVFIVAKGIGEDFVLHMEWNEECYLIALHCIQTLPGHRSQRGTEATSPQNKSYVKFNKLFVNKLSIWNNIYLIKADSTFGIIRCCYALMFPAQ